MKQSTLDYDDRANGIGGVPKVGEGKGYREGLDGIFGLELGRDNLESWLLEKGSTLSSPALPVAPYPFTFLSRNMDEAALLFRLCCSVAKLCPTLCDPTSCSTPGFSVYHCLSEFAQTHVL